MVTAIAAEGMVATIQAGSVTAADCPTACWCKLAMGLMPALVRVGVACLSQAIAPAPDLFWAA
eukprot:364360-Chlamydomonas_euryale.AAC.2